MVEIKDIMQFNLFGYDSTLNHKLIKVLSHD